MARFTLDAAAEFLFGAELHSISEPFILPKDDLRTPVRSANSNLTSSAFIVAVRETQQLIARRLWLGPIWMMQELFGDKSTALMKDINKFLDPIVQDALARGRDVTKTPDEIGNDMTFLEHMVSQTKG